MTYLLRTNGNRANRTFWLASRIAAPATIATLPKWKTDISVAIGATAKAVLSGADGNPDVTPNSWLSRPLPC